MTVRLIRGDCLKVLKTLDHVDAVITDPPYGISYRNNRSDIRPWQRFAGVIAGDADQSTGQAAIDLARQNGWPVCAFAHARSPWAGDWRQFLVWDKGPAVGAGGDRATCFKFTWELIQVGGFGVLNGKREPAVLRYQVGQNAHGLHPNQKPLTLMRYLVAKLTQPGDTVLDPFMGSGTTGVACQETGRNFIGIESDRHYFNVAKRRIKEARVAA
jgi:site-specific DNA-methyltransferase (adenine-specific)